MSGVDGGSQRLELDVAEKIQLSLYGREGGPGLPEDVKKMPLRGGFMPIGRVLGYCSPGGGRTVRGVGAGELFS